MGIPVFIPQPLVALTLPDGEDVTFCLLCELAGVRSRVTGLSTGRPLRISPAANLSAVKLPGALSPVWLGVPAGTPRRRALLALGLLAYGVFDYAARETLRGLQVSRACADPGRPSSGRALSPAERQRRHRQKKAA
jgi:hypothetical protein